MHSTMLVELKIAGLEQAEQGKIEPCALRTEIDSPSLPLPVTDGLAVDSRTRPTTSISQPHRATNGRCSI